ncbi:hypothetical protein RI367_000828 [Sorochytrium milnesiophthora]
MEIESQDVVRLMLQFLKENNLTRTMSVLQEETGVCMNTVDNVESFKQDVLQGRWDVVLRLVSGLKVPRRKLIDLYEQIIIELIEARELSAARTMLRQTEPMDALRDQFPDRYLRLESLLSRTYFEPSDSYPEGHRKEKRREIIAQALASEVTTVPPARLLTLLGQALKWQHSQGLLPPDASFDLFRGVVPLTHAEEDATPTTCYNTIKFPKKQHAECACFSPDGQFLVTGSADGFIEVWNYLTGKLRKDLKYQAEDRLMVMESAVLCLTFAPDSDMLAAGDQDGNIKVWKLVSGQLLRKFAAAHTQGITSVAFSRDGGHLLSASFDGTVRVHGFKSGKMLREFRGHTSFVNGAAYTADGARILSASSDGSVKVWDAKSAECITTLFPTDEPGARKAVNSLSLVPSTVDQFVACSRSTQLRVMNAKGQAIKTFVTSEAKPQEFVYAVVSPKGEYVHALAGDAHLYSFHIPSGSTTRIKTHESGDVIGVVHHPFSNILATWGDDSQVMLWK